MWRAKEGALVFIVAFTMPIGGRAETSDLRKFLKDFDKNPEAAMAVIPPKRDSQNRIVAGEFDDRKNMVHRPSIGDNGIESLSEIAGNDRAENLVELPTLVKNPFEMEAKNLTKASVTGKAWSDSYWPFYKGTLGDRYNDLLFPNLSDWSANYAYVTKNNAYDVFMKNGPDAENISPSEKYDILMEDKELSLTDSNWNRGRMYYELYGKVETWMGICNGWAAASYLEPEPLRKVFIPTRTGPGLTFYPSDLRALASLLWETEVPRTRYISSRCNEKNPRTNDNGRTLDQQCFDTNPGTWHVAVVNQIGVAKQPFIMDARWDYEVWNQPVISYAVSYFNPQTMAPAASAAAGQVKLQDFSKDPFKEFRSGKTESVIGVSMDVTYVIESVSDHAEVPKLVTRTVTYIYDLELDRESTIIGGEWYNYAHPDFLWKPVDGARAMSFEDRGLNDKDWSGQTELPQTWLTAGSRASKRGEPLGTVVERLISLAQPLNVSPDGKR